ncbi:hypothetical protein ABH920_007131 [Catenulispora sp. EB89]|uniref:hypothetical protein n=1 Tax=Catenulispora sp. EB89 TaxID=3156257 RepID=UPI003513C8B3
MPNTGDEREPESTPQHDPAAWRALAVAAALGIPATALTVLSVLVGGRGLTTNGLYAGWLFGAVGFGGALAVVLALHRRCRRAWRWFWAWTSVPLPVLTVVVAVEVSRHA